MPDTGGGEAAASAAEDPGAQDFGWALGTVLRAYVKAAGEAVAGLPGGPRALQVLGIAAAGSCRNQAAIADLLAIDRTIMTYLIDDLEAEKLVERRPDPADRRSRQIHLTAKGKEVLGEMRERVNRVERQVLAGLSDSEVQVLRSLLGRAATDADTEGSHTQDACSVAADLDITG